MSLKTYAFGLAAALMVNFIAAGVIEVFDLDKNALSYLIGWLAAIAFFAVYIYREL